MKKRKEEKQFCQWHETMETPSECSMKPTIQPKHTPGPWRVGKHNDVVFSGTQERPVVVANNCGANSGADARLIAAAPDLYDVIAWLLNEVEENGQGNLPDGLLGRARSVIAKAEGL